MRYFPVYFGAYLFVQSLLAFDPETPGEVVAFVQISEAKALYYNPIAAEDGFDDLSREQKIEKLRKVFPEPAKLLEYVEALPMLAKKIISDEFLLMCVPYGCRRFLPEQYHGISFKALTPFDFTAQSAPILAIGGTIEEAEVLKTKFNIDPSSYCSINVLYYTKPNYLGDMVKSEHVALFKDKFAFAFTRAVPFSKEHLPAVLINIASSLKEDGIFIGEIFGDHRDDKALEKALLEANFKSFLVFGHKEFDQSHGVYFVATREAFSLEEIEHKLANRETLKALKDYVLTGL
jgi:hypothetical protein